MLSDQQILEILSRQPAPEEACRQLIDAANEAGGKDNITAVDRGGRQRCRGMSGKKQQTNQHFIRFCPECLSWFSRSNVHIPIVNIRIGCPTSRLAEKHG